MAHGKLFRDRCPLADVPADRFEVVNYAVLDDGSICIGTAWYRGFWTPARDMGPAWIARLVAEVRADLAREAGQRELFAEAA